MSWSYPKLVLTEHEKKFCSLYPGEPGKQPVQERFYSGFLKLTETDRHPVFPFQIARRCKVRMLTFSGDIAHFKLQIASATGENYFGLDGSRIAHYIPGWNASAQQGGFPAPLPPLPEFRPVWVARYTTPFVFRPFITLLSNNTLTFTGHQTEAFESVGVEPPVGIDYRIDFVLDVIEFPSMEDEEF